MTPGFSDPAAGAQVCFRTILDAMARPGCVKSVSGVTAPAPLCDAAASVVLTLLDHETPLWLDPLAEAARPWIEFHTGAPKGASFAMALSLPDLNAFSAGTDEMPETSATIVVQVASLTEGRAYRLEGPGLRQPAVVRITGLPDDFASIWQRNHALFPRGIDLILCAGNTLTALPRSVSVKEA